MKSMLGTRIKYFRNQLGISQEILAGRLGVTAQAVSKWECEQAYPDIELLPELAEIFHVSIDSLFRETKDTPQSGLELPKDDVLRIVQVLNGEILSRESYDPERKITLKLAGLRENVHIEVWGSITAEGDINGDVAAGGCVACGDVAGNVTTNMACGDVHGDVEINAYILCGDVDGDAATNIKYGDVDGDAAIKAYVECSDVGGDVTANGSVECGDVDGDVSANSYVECSDVGGDVTANGSVECGDVDGDVSANSYVECGDVDGDVSTNGYVECGDVSGNVTAGSYVECGDIGGAVVES